jgi:hypothetical protein
MATKTAIRYVIREYKGASYSRPVGYNQRLRDRKRAMRLVKRLRKLGRDVFAAPMRVAVS